MCGGVIGLSGESFMAIVVEAIYENGVLKLSEPLRFKEHEKVTVTVQAVRSPLVDGYGIMGFTGGPEEGDYYALDPELGYPPPPAEP
jgi:predicted DNA-binding antitoxin AbrB/MazE fold protein